VTAYIKVHPVANAQNDKQNVSVTVQLGNEEDFTLATAARKAGVKVSVCPGPLFAEME
jgi:hypothetical protein